jgi:hypothetical protein
MTTVNLSGTWSEKQRPNNGLERVAAYVHGNRLARIPIVGYVEFHQYTEKLTGNVLTVAIPAVEPAYAADGTDPTGAGEQIWQILDQLRKQHGKGAVADTLFSVARDGFDFDDPDGPEGDDEELQGQMRLGPDGEREVPPPSGEEVVAELEERRAAKKAKPTTEPFKTDDHD